MTGKGHPLPDSAEARHGEIPEHLERDKGRGDDGASAVQPAGEAVDPDGKPYRAGDLGRAPDSTKAKGDLAADQAAHQDRGQSIAERESGDA